MPCSIHESIFRHNRVMCLHSNAHTLLTNLNEKMDLQPRANICQNFSGCIKMWHRERSRVISLTDSWVKYNPNNQIWQSTSKHFRSRCWNLPMMMMMVTRGVFNTSSFFCDTRCYSEYLHKTILGNKGNTRLCHLLNDHWNLEGNWFFRLKEKTSVRFRLNMSV